jgi:hypothetical protein
VASCSTTSSASKLPLQLEDETGRQLSVALFFCALHGKSRASNERLIDSAGVLGLIGGWRLKFRMS